MDTERPCGVACDDGVILHTQYSTHWDSLAHWGTLFDANGDGREEIVYYNGYRGGEHVLSPVGQMPPQALALGIEKLAETCVQGRAVLISLADAFGPDRTHVDYDMLVATMATQHAEVGPGDFLLLHSGFDDALLAMQREPSERVLSRTGALLDGRDDRLRSWIRESGVVAICSDTATIEAPYPDSETGGRTMLPLHELCLFELGIFLGELWRLGDLARWLRAHGRSACLLTAPPLRLPGATGSPVTPVALV